MSDTRYPPDDLARLLKTFSEPPPMPVNRINNLMRDWLAAQQAAMSSRTAGVWLASDQVAFDAAYAAWLKGEGQ